MMMTLLLSYKNRLTIQLLIEQLTFCQKLFGLIFFFFELGRFIQRFLNSNQLDKTDNQAVYCCILKPCLNHPRLLLISMQHYEPKMLFMAT